jgi:Protein of unknown function (DUF3037)
MASRYSVIQYVPNPIADERINIGVLAFDQQTVKVHFLSNWDRVRVFGRSQDMSTLRNFADRMQKSAAAGQLFPGDELSGDELNNTPNHERLLKIVQGWINQVQFTEPRKSLDTVDNLLNDAIATYLLEPETKPKLRDRQAAARIAQNKIKQALIDKLGENRAQELLKPDYRISGKLQPHIFDIAIANGRPLLAAHGLSFEVQTSNQVTDSLAWMIADVKNHQPDFPLGILALPPQENSPHYQKLNEFYCQTILTYERLGATMINENNIDPWASANLAAIT